MKHRIKKVRKEKGLTQAQLAKLLGMTPQGVSSIENSDSVTTNTLEKVAAALGCEVLDLMPFDEFVKASTAELNALNDAYLEQLNESARLLNHVGKIALYKIALQMSYDPDYTTIDETELLKAWAFLPEDVKEYGRETEERQERTREDQ